MQKQIAKNGGSKGITLIALVITIIVLLILAGVTISMVLGDDGIIAQATQAKTAQEEAEKGEQEEIRKGEGNIDLYTEGTVANMVEVGEYVEYKYTPNEYSTAETGDIGVDAQTFSSNPETDGNAVVEKWRVLSKENGIVKLISENSVTSLTLKGVNGYLNGIKVLDEMCKTLYSSDIGTARSITLDDINEVSGYIPTTARVGNIEGTGTVEVPYGITIKEAADRLEYDMKNFNTYTIEKGKNIDDYKITTDNYAVWLESGITQLEEEVLGEDCFWLASTRVRPLFSKNILAYDILVYNFLQIENNLLCSNDSDIVGERENENEFRPIVILNTGLEIKSGTGTREMPWVIRDN